MLSFQQYTRMFWLIHDCPHDGVDWNAEEAHEMSTYENQIETGLGRKNGACRVSLDFV